MVNHRQNGFTLIELSIVLVIIGLIAGGIMVGRDLIHAAEIRATVKQIEQLNTAVNAFQLKYNCLPGDCPNATDLGLASYDGVSAHANGNGDGRIMFMNGIPYEPYNALWQLQQVGLIGNVTLDASGNSTLLLSIGSNSSLAIQYLVPDPINNVSITAAAQYYWINNGFYPVLLPIDAFALDNKMDDGLPRSGTIMATGAARIIADPTNFNAPVFNPATDVGPAGAASNYCVTNDSPNQYNLQNTSRVWGPLCALTVKTQF